MRTEKIRVRVLINKDGQWAAYGWKGASPGDEEDTLYVCLQEYDVTTSRMVDLTAEIPVPEIEEIMTVVSSIVT
jgi:hypothetical protein